jgi:hypothetical protein
MWVGGLPPVLVLGRERAARARPTFVSCAFVRYYFLIAHFSKHDSSAAGVNVSPRAFVFFNALTQR